MTPSDSIKIVIHLQRRPDGGLRVWSDDVPGLVLSHADAGRVMADIIPAVETIMGEVLGCSVRASELVSARSVIPTARRPRRLGERIQGLAGRLFAAGEETREYAAAPCPI